MTAEEFEDKFKDVIPFKGFMFPNEISKYAKQCVLIAEAYHKHEVEAISDEIITDYWGNDTAFKEGAKWFKNRLLNK